MYNVKDLRNGNNALLRRIERKLKKQDCDFFEKSKKIKGIKEKNKFKDNLFYEKTKTKLGIFGRSR